MDEGRRDVLLIRFVDASHAGHLQKRLRRFLLIRYGLGHLGPPWLLTSESLTRCDSVDRRWSTALNHCVAYRWLLWEVWSSLQRGASSSSVRLPSRARLFPRNEPAEHAVYERRLGEVGRQRYRPLHGQRGGKGPLPILVEHQPCVISFELNVPDEQFDPWLVAHQHHGFDILGVANVEMLASVILLLQPRHDPIGVLVDDILF